MFSTLDANCGYWNIHILEADRNKTFVTTHSGTYRYSSRPLGLRNAPETFQLTLDIILSGVRWPSCLDYLDEVIVFSTSESKHVEDVEEFLKLLRNSGVTVTSEKGAFFEMRVDYLGHTILPGKLMDASAPTQSIL